MKYKIQKTLDTHDSNNVVFTDDDGKKIGFGYIGKKSKRVGLMRCPECNRENYAMQCSIGVCAFCGFDANTIVTNLVKELYEQTR